MSSTPTTEKWDAPELGVRTFRAVLLYFEGTCGRAKLEEAWARAGLPLPLSHVENLAGFVSLAFVERMFDVLLEGSGDPEFFAKAGRHSATPEALGFVYYLLRGVASPELVYKQTVDMSSAFNRVGKFVVDTSGPRSLTLSYTSRQRERNRNLCVCRMGTFASFPHIWGLPDAEVKETQCQVDGAPCCTYELKWRARPPVAWRRWGFGVIGALAGLGVAASGLVPGPWMAL